MAQDIDVVLASRYCGCGVNCYNWPLWRILFLSSVAKKSKNHSKSVYIRRCGGYVAPNDVEVFSFFFN